MSTYVDTYVLHLYITHEGLGKDLGGSKKNMSESDLGEDA